MTQCRHPLRYLTVVARVPAALAAQSTPSFDCAQASGSVQELICASDQLAALDRELAAVWEEALARLPEDEVSATSAFQRGWIKGRDDCVTLTWAGEETVCRPAGGATGVPAGEGHCTGLPVSTSFVVVREPAAGARVSGRVTVEGCSRTFESHVVWRLAGRDGATAREGFTSGGGVDGPGAFSFALDLGGLAPGLYHLEVSEPLVTEEEGFPPSRTVLPVIVEVD
jgi:uncharacterized protein YecT (DUF1311 family)